TNGPTNVFFEAYDVGDGTLNPQATGSPNWLTPSVDTARPCTFDGSKSCRPVRVLLNASGLAAGAYSGVVTVGDPNAFDAPQRVRVTVYVNGNVPSRLDFYAAPAAGANDSVSFQTPSGPPPSFRATTQSGGNWLAVSSSGMGSFQFLYTHKVQATVQSAMAAGDYNGELAVSNSAFAGDNRSVPVTLHVSAQPIVRVAPQLRLRAIQGGAAVEQAVSVANGGRGTLTVSGATASGGAWLTASVGSSGAVQLKADPASLTPGYYNATVAISSNAANSPVTVPVELEVQAASAPLADFAGVVDAASFVTPVGGGALASLFGSQLAAAVAQAQSIPLPSTLADTSVFVNDVAAPLIFVSPGQVNFQMPFEASSGTARVRVERQGQRGNTVTVPVGRRGPGLYGFPGTTYGIVINASRTDGLFFAWPDIPALAGVAKAPAKPGDFLVLYGSGFGPTNPAVATGAAAGSDPVSGVIETPRVNFGRGAFGPFADPLFVGLTPGFVGLYQVNVQAPAGLPANQRSPVSLAWPDGTTSNIVEFAVAP
ncbi:MAG: hypothetical protein HY238_26855, partial [Acidobacteria bacterium]|nr:hypothetical protein [Acidobacteriota bacterium]